MDHGIITAAEATGQTVASRQSLFGQYGADCCNVIGVYRHSGESRNDGLSATWRPNLKLAGQGPVCPLFVEKHPTTKLVLLNRGHESTDIDTSPVLRQSFGCLQHSLQGAATGREGPGLAWLE